MAAPIRDPFGSARPVETPDIEAVPVGPPTPFPDPVAFLDGIQRYAIEARIGIVPIVRGYVAAAVMGRRDRVLEVFEQRSEEFLVAARARLEARQWAALTSSGLEVIDCEVGGRAHPIMDVRSAALEVESRRDRLERRLAEEHCTHRSAVWLVADGSVAKVLPGIAPSARLIGLIKSHDTQYLEDRDLEVALTLPAGHRTSVFERVLETDTGVYSWYLRLWPWEAEELLHGLVRIERPPGDGTVRTASDVSRWLLAERAPLAAPDGRWDRLCYPIQQVETYLHAQLGSWW